MLKHWIETGLSQVWTAHLPPADKDSDRAAAARARRIAWAEATARARRVAWAAATRGAV